MGYTNWTIVTSDTDYAEGEEPRAVICDAAATGTITGANGVAIDIADLTDLALYELSPRNITPTAGSVYALW